MRIQTDNFGSADHFRARLHRDSYNYELHLHQFAEVMLVLDGEIEVNLGDRVETAKEGDFILILPFQPHGYKTSAHSTTFCAVFSESLLPDFFSKCEGKIGERAVFRASDDEIALWKSTMIAPIEKDKTYTPSNYAIKAALYLAADAFLKSIPLCEARRAFGKADLIVDYLLANCRENVTLSEMAKSLGYAENYLSHKITAMFGMNFPTLLACFRVEHAKRMLRDKSARMIDIAEECGFGSERSFDRTFKKITGQTPSEYRKNL